jgi:hypothetical protein
MNETMMGRNTMENQPFIKKTARIKQKLKSRQEPISISIYIYINGKPFFWPYKW